MSLIYKRIIKFFLFLGITSFLFWLVYRDQNWSDLVKALKEDVDYTWIWGAIGMGILSHICPGLEVAIAHGFYGLSDSFGK